MVVNGVDFSRAKSLEHQTRESIEQEAKQWLIRMDGDEPLTEAEKKALKEWMSRSAFHAGELTRLARLWSRANVMTELLGCLESHRREQRKARGLRLKKTLTSSWIRTTLMAATAIVSSVVLIYCSLR
jgi:ferric-dicitrate binding protein FerR (iron transport regulator)